MNDIYARFLKLADRKGQVFDYDLEALLFFTKLDEEDDLYHLDQMNVMSGSNGSIPTATVRLRVGRRTRTESSIGNGPVDAVFNCITHLTGVKFTLKSYEISANGSGMDALGQVDVTIESEDGRIFHGMGLSTDVIESSCLALLRAINNIERAKRIQSEKSGRDIRLSSIRLKPKVSVTTQTSRQNLFANRAPALQKRKHPLKNLPLPAKPTSQAVQITSATPHHFNKLRTRTFQAYDYKNARLSPASRSFCHFHKY